MGWIRRLSEQPLRTKLIITAVGTAVVVFGVASSLTFRYWRQESVAAAEQQALLAAASVRSSVESAITEGQPGRARSALRELVELESITAARVYGTAGRVLVSTIRSEEGSRPAGVWLPSPRELPSRGTARVVEGGEQVNAFLPLRAGGAGILEVDFSLAPLEAAMDRAARLGLLLLIGSLAAVILIVATMLEREVVTPIERVVDILGPEGPRRSDELGGLEESVADLVRKEREHEQRLASQAGLAEVGEMAAEMAHEFKRPLASIRSAVSLLEQEYELNTQAQSLLDAVDGQLGKLTETMQDLFALAKPVELESDRVNLRDAVDEALGQLAGLMDTSSYTIRRTYQDDLPPLLGDQHRIEQAALNVMLNALEAMEDGGTLQIQLSADGDRVVAEFTDTGPGLPEEEVEKIIRPFYSTKPAGTGLGLPLVARVMSAHAGKLDIRSEPGRGTTVRLSFPTQRAASTPAERSAGQARRGGEAEAKSHAGPKGARPDRRGASGSGSQRVDASDAGAAGSDADQEVSGGE
ncbi:MAG: sensor histidine kinase [Candidatus Longimicrobiales bacterium M2_2A_002]